MNAPQSSIYKSLFTQNHKSLFSPGVDFLTVGGLSYIFIIFINIFPISLGLNLTIALGLAYVVNDPHFLSSYQLFYSDFKNKLLGNSLNKYMQIRYIIAGIFIPFLILIYFAASYFYKAPEMLFFSANIMLFFVGWHYTKQSYGMLITLSALKRVYYPDLTKKILLWNSYVIWFTTWIYMNNSISEYNFFGAELSFFKFPTIILNTSLALSLAFGLLTAGCLYSHYLKKSQFSINGIIGYSTAYIWLFFRWSEPATYLLIPMFHSLQYIPFVLRYKINESKIISNLPFNKDATNHSYGSEAQQLKKIAQLSPEFLVFRFIIFALLFGYLGFHFLPMIFDAVIPYDRAIFGPTLFLFIFIVFINIHHYFIDNVLWRKENKDISQYLFHK